MEQRQKLISFFLHDKASGSYGDPKSNKLFGICEHLEEFLQDGWRVEDFKVLGGAGGCLSGWVIVLLQKTSL